MPRGNDLQQHLVGGAGVGRYLIDVTPNIMAGFGTSAPALSATDATMTSSLSDELATHTAEGHIYSSAGHDLNTTTSARGTCTNSRSEDLDGDLYDDPDVITMIKG